GGTGGGGGAGKDNKKPPPPPPAPPVDVLLITTHDSGGFYFAYIKVAGQVVTLEPSKTIQLKPGSYKVQARADNADDWKPVGRIRIDSGKNYRVRLLSTWKLKQETL
ncbi:hypothetical protein, partial [Enhygromyxa salina]|uniref:hypothetical protein n=1 Tax=Enhygromyxa salina TaxID=215803 RepID=UPI0015E6D2E7